ncbi:unnamed protein product [Meloidogyne enterolobii]|uniref:Uncharacterized protein n=1 Tax=Meloidogyne enterolobii TaxID=390850 RepID=A0ACB0Y7A8_MELEN
MVHYVYVKEGYTYEEALKRPDGIVISAIFLEIGGNGHALSIIEKYLPQVVLYRKKNLKNKIKNLPSGKTVKIPNFIVGFSIPDKWNEYYRYDGSFTRPNCAEVVNWIILPGPVQFTQKQVKFDKDPSQKNFFSQLDLFRKIEGPNGKALGSNVRPTQPLNQRRVEHRPPNC